jgi:aminoglycoside/choline kinase family phosphotransferase
MNSGEARLQPIVDSFSIFAGTAPTKVESVEAHASGRVIARLSGTGVGTVIGSHEPDWAEASAFLYLARHFKAHSLPVPQIFFVDQSRQIVLMEDLGRETLYDLLCHERIEGAEVPESVEDLYHRALSDLPKFQYEAGRLVDFARCHPVPEFSPRDMRADCQLFLNSLVDVTGIRGNRPALESELALLVDLLSKDTSWDTFMYRDFQSRNIVVRDVTLGYIDFQGGRRGPLAYDVASLLYQSRAGLSAGMRSRLLTSYCKAANVIPQFNEEVFRSEFDKWVIIRLLQAVGRAGELGFRKKKELFWSGLPKGLALLQAVLQSPQLSFQPVALRSYVDALLARFPSEPQRD